MLIGMRNAMLAGGAALPYDAEVEYLESTGTQWIDTGVLYNQSTILEVGFFWNITAYNMCVFGVYDNSSGTTIRAMVQFPQGRKPNAYWGSSLTSVTASSDLSTWHDCILGNKIFKIDGATVQTWSDDNFQFSASMFIFARHVKNVNDPSSMVDSLYYGRISYVRIKQNGVLVHDLIPVRKGNVGYMYDRVSGELFGNAGTGAFVIGPDK